MALPSEVECSGIVWPTAETSWMVLPDSSLSR